MRTFIKTLVIAITLLISVSSSNAQKKKAPVIEIPEFAIDETTKLVVYNEVVQQKGTKGELYDKALAWAMKFYKSPSNVLRERDKENAKLVARSRFYTFYTDPKKGTKTRMGTIEYTLTFAFKEGRYRYEITKINYKAQSYQGVEQWIDGNKKEYNYATASYLVQVDEELKKVVADFKASIAKVEKAAESW
ncbi:MAG: DUF4468 domain-containing protein [Flavobacteriales bacterium]|nr:DUF4468 domain-containing protein [Flavobacteriales bacterium]